MISGKDEIVRIDESNDFGFTFIDNNQLIDEKDMLDLENRLKEIRKMFLPLLLNLNKNPEKDMIKWPNRKDILDAQIKKLLSLTEV